MAFLRTQAMKKETNSGVYIKFLNYIFAPPPFLIHIFLLNK